MLRSVPGRPSWVAPLRIASKKQALAGLLVWMMVVMSMGVLYRRRYVLLDSPNLLSGGRLLYKVLNHKSNILTTQTIPQRANATYLSF